MVAVSGKCWQSMSGLAIIHIEYVLASVLYIFLGLCGKETSLILSYLILSLTLRLHIITLDPSCANLRAISYPMPRVEPVIIDTLPSNFPILFFCYNFNFT